MKIANIISTNQVNVSEDFNVVNSMGEIIHGIPTLIVGFDYVNKHYPDFDIMEREVEPNIYWIFKKTERRDEFETGLKWFTQKCYNDKFKETPYVFVDIMQYKMRTLYKIYKKILNLEKKVTLIKGNMMYIYGDKILFGIDLKLVSFSGGKDTKLKEKIKSKSDVFLDINDILIVDKNIINELGPNIRYLPYLLSIRNEQNNTTSGLHLS